MRNRLATVVILTFMGAVLYAGLAGRDVYPFSSFPMYRDVRVDPYRVEHYELVGITADGRLADGMISPLGTSLLLRWARDAEGDVRRLELLSDLLLNYNRRLRPELELQAVRITKATYTIPAYPSRDRPEKSDVEIVYETQP